jgi:pyruvate dehydrogenase E1 component alpha subunit
MVTREDLITFESKIADLFRKGKIRVPIHLSGGNEDELIEIFKEIRQGDYVFSTHRNHYHYLLHGGDPTTLLNSILSSSPMGSMHTIDNSINFYSSGIVAGCVAIAVGVAYALKLKGDKRRVHCFIGDGATDEGWFYEALKYAVCMNLPIMYIIEDNNRSVCTTKDERWGEMMYWRADEDQKITWYSYKPTYPHAGVGEFIPL